ncbi:MAG: acetoacetate--CoA ligase [Actinomycetota bacterium]|jgi:acetoacetyl-CoA synthetase|nr:acetoacetate--CoA ligase [Actinomycetota bacterium]
MDAAPVAATSYDALWRWSVDDLPAFWSQVWNDTEVVASRQYHQVLGKTQMPGAVWFAGARLNYAQNLLRHSGSGVALIGAGEGMVERRVTWDELHRMVAAVQVGLIDLGIVRGDRVAAFLPNCVEAVVAMLATTALGAVWSSCSPDFGPMGVVDRFGQIRPKILLAADGYRYHGRTHSLREKVKAVCEALPELDHLVLVDFVDEPWTLPDRPVVCWSRLLDAPAGDVHFEQVPADHPLFVLYSSGTTGVPKSIVHGHCGTLLQHRKEHHLHTDLHAGEHTILWFTTCGWMMWNWLVSALASGVTVVLYDGSPTYPGPQALWELAERTSTSHFGTSPKFLAACAKAGLRPTDAADLHALQTVLSTGAPLHPDQFDWVYEHVGQDLQLSSVSGGTDLIGCFAAGAPILPVRRGELQCRCLGMAVEAWDPSGRSVVGEPGELVCTRPFPSMPTGFWGDEDGSRYRAAYFTANPGVWTHGDLVEIRPEGGMVIHGRSDTTLNPSGVRIGTAEIYRAIEPLAEIADAIVVGRPVKGDTEIVLCVRLAQGVELDAALTAHIRDTIREATTPRHVPAHVLAVADIPYTISGKKVERAVADTISGATVHNRDALANPSALDEYAKIRFDE